MSILTISSALALALACSPKSDPVQPQVSPDVLISVASAESGLDPLAIHDNATGATLHPQSSQDAIALAEQLIAAGHRPDLGLMQINSPANLSRTGLTAVTAFDPCSSMRAGAQILLENYSGGSSSAEQQSAILHSFSAYNTGSPVGGLRTYVPLVLASAQKVIPALRLPGLMPYVPPAPAALPSPASGCEPGRWHYAASDACHSGSSWHFPAVQGAAAQPAEPAPSAKPTIKEVP